MADFAISRSKCRQLSGVNGGVRRRQNTGSAIWLSPLRFCWTPLADTTRMPALVDAVGRSVPFSQHAIALGVLSRAADENLTGLVALLERYPASRLLAGPPPRRWRGWRRAGRPSTTRTCTAPSRSAATASSSGSRANASL
jgi:hypothetical protein